MVRASSNRGWKPREYVVIIDALEEFDEFCRSTKKNGNKQGDGAYEADTGKGGGEFVVRGMVLT